MPADLRKARELFLHAVGQLPPEQWESYLVQACGGDIELRQQVAHFLSVHREAGSFLAAPEPLAATIEDPVRERPGTVIGPYKLLEQIGKGGMGLVFVAEQQHPVRRKVALKIIKPGMDSAQVIARFEAERQALAMMDHQNIARVHDAGTTESGRPYFVMELVHGVPITDYCDANQLTPRQRLELFVPVCQAIQHAHQKGVIHRDIKPSNILVTMYDDKAVPKVIDFGVAKAVEQRLTERTVYTQFGTLVGTLEYMSPEQAEMNALGVDTRSDIYALGVLLYELLTGTTPLERPRLRDAAFGEIIRLIKEEEPPRPSVRLSTSAALAKVAGTRKTDPAKLSALLRGELDWIVMRCLEKDRTRRYDTASGLARDVERYLKDEPIEARPPSVGYQLGKFVRRNRAAAMTAAAVMAALVLGTVVASWQAFCAREAERRAEAERDRTLQAQVEADRARKLEEEAKAKAVAMFRAEEKAKGEAIRTLQQLQTEVAIAREVNDFIRLLFLKAAPDSKGDSPFTLRALLDFASKRIDKERPKHPVAEGALRDLLGHGYALCGDRGNAEKQRELAYQLRSLHLGEADPRTLDTTWWLALTYGSVGKHDQAEGLLRKMLELCQRAYGPDNEWTQKARYNLACTRKQQTKYAEAEPLFREFAEIQQRLHGDEDLAAWSALTQLGQCYRDEGKYDLAVPLFVRLVVKDSRRVHILGKPAGNVLMGPVLDDLGKTLLLQQKGTEAAARLQEGLNLLKAVKPAPWKQFAAESLLGGSLLGQKKYSDAEALLLAGYEGLKAHEPKIPDQEKQRLTEVLKHLVQLYEEWAKPNEATMWRKKLEARRTLPQQPLPPVGLLEMQIHSLPQDHPLHLTERGRKGGTAINRII
jgi:serine/threonine protein kinase/tetratricopeptide (TPR) repeat protein